MRKLQRTKQSTPLCFPSIQSWVLAVFCRWLEQWHNMVWGERGKGKLYSPLFMLAKHQGSPLGQSVFLSPINNRFDCDIINPSTARVFDGVL